MPPAAPRKKGKRLDWLKSFVPDPSAWDSVKVPPQTAWRLDRMKHMTYTQFWQLVKERRVDQASAAGRGPHAPLPRCCSTGGFRSCLTPAGFPPGRDGRCWCRATCWGWAGATLLAVFGHQCINPVHLVCDITTD